jgi:hypothetical protein
VNRCGSLRQFGWMILCLTLILISGRASAQDYTKIEQDMLNHGEERSGIISLSFIEDDVRQYAVADGMSLTFIEEHWSKSGRDDVIDQWFVKVEPDWAATHRRIVEGNSGDVSVEYLDTEGADDVVHRMLRKDEMAFASR